MTVLSRNGGLLMPLILAGCAITGQLPPSQSAESQVVTAPAQLPLPYYPPECSTNTPVGSPHGLGDAAVYHDVCRVGWDGRVAPLAFSVLLGDENSATAASFRFTAGALAMRSRDIISFPNVVKPDHFDPIPWNSATDGPRRTESPGIRGEFRLLGRETVAYTPPGETKTETCVPVSFTLPPQDSPLGRIAGTTTRLLRCASDHVYRVPAFAP